MGQYQLSASRWRCIEDFLPGWPGHVGVTAKDSRSFVNGVLRALRSGARWKDLPAEYGNWESVHKRFIRRAKIGLWERIFRVTLEDPDNRYSMVDSTIVQAHQQAAGGKRGTKIRLWGVPEGD